MKAHPLAENTILGLMFAIVTVAVIVVLLAGLREIFHFAQQFPVDEMKDSFPRR